MKAFVNLGMNPSIRKSAQKKIPKSYTTASTKNYVETLGNLQKKSTDKYNFYAFQRCKTKELEKIDLKQILSLTKTNNR